MMDDKNMVFIVTVGYIDLIEEPDRSRETTIGGVFDSFEEAESMAENLKSDSFDDVSIVTDAWIDAYPKNTSLLHELPETEDHYEIRE